MPASHKLSVIILLSVCAINILYAPPKKDAIQLHDQVWLLLLPDEVIEFILKYLDRKEWINFGLTCTANYSNFCAGRFLPCTSNEHHDTNTPPGSPYRRIVRDWCILPQATIIYCQIGTRRLKLFLPTNKTDRLTCTHLSWENKRLAAGTCSGCVIMLENIDFDCHQTSHPFYFCEKHHSAINSVKFSPDGETLAAASQEGLITVWNVANKNLIAVFAHSQNRIFPRIPPSVEDNQIKIAVGVCFMPNTNDELVSFSYENGIVFWPPLAECATATEGVHLRLNLPQQNTLYITQGSLDISDDHKLLVFIPGDYSGNTMIFDIENIHEPALIDELHNSLWASYGAKFLDDAGNKISISQRIPSVVFIWKRAPSLEEIQQKIRAAKALNVKQVRCKDTLCHDCLCQ